MSGSILIARPATGTSANAAPTAAQRLLRQGIVARLRGLRAGAIRLRDHQGEELLGDPDAPLGTIALEVHDPAFWSAVVWSGDVGAGEAYVAGQWSCSDLVKLLQLFVRDRAVLLDVDQSMWSLPRRLLLRVGQWLRRNHKRGSERNIADHYDLGDELFEHFLDPSMTYSSAWFEHEGQSLADAQQHKLQQLCRLVELQPTDHLLEIGTGWGSMALCAAGKFGAKVTTTTISRNQYGRAQQRIAAAGLQDRVELLLRDYRDLDGSYDKLVSCEMIEAVGAKFLPTYLRTCAQRLRPGGLFGLQAITIADQHYAEALRTVDYIKRHVFPGSFIPSVNAIVGAATEHTDLRVEKLEDFGHHYARTLQQWRQTVLAAPEPFLQRGGPALVRAWEYYFAYCEAGFRERHIGVCQLRFRRAGG
ncbi:MAG: cyclopropane-fatty-acyl-phospholipid synthase family protein [Planctomycetes bacterium]|jgi:cyclopropane-fatty-acyl-phospholipid synthase|nr:cyclopropane-fatty-acyl-phospholipid synthase family protein [Planctomycetota bacterium]